jgi:hypothetical protein
MAAVVTAPARPGVISVPRWVWAAVPLAVVLLWLVLMEVNVFSPVLGGNMFLHELFHDARHLLGVPCH